MNNGGSCSGGPMQVPKTWRSSTTTSRTGRMRPPAALNVPRTRIERIAREEKPVTADTALRLGKFFKTSAACWMNIQARFDLETAEDVLAPQIKRIAAYKAA